MVTGLQGDPSKGAASDIVYVGMVDLWRSTNGGTNWQWVADECRPVCLGHGDTHALAVDPFDPSGLLVGNDGGVYRVEFIPNEPFPSVVSLNRTLQVSQFYDVSASTTNYTVLLGAVQDNGVPAPMGGLNKWGDVGGGDGMSCAIAPGNDNLQYATTNFFTKTQATLNHTKNRWQDQLPPIPLGLLVNDKRYFGPMAADPRHPALLYLATNYLNLWNDVAGQWQFHLGGTQLAANGWVNAIAISQIDNQRIYTVSNDGLVFMTRDGGSHWTRIDSNLPSGEPLTSISISPVNPSDVLVGIWRGATVHHIWRCADTTSALPQWRDVSNQAQPNMGLPDVAINSIARDEFDPDHYWYVGTDIGVFYTDDGGTHWYNATQPLGLPNVPVTHLENPPGSQRLYAATFGRGIWQADLSSGNLPLPPTNCFVWSLTCGNQASLLCNPLPDSESLVLLSRRANQTPPAAWSGAGVTGGTPSSPAMCVYDGVTAPTDNEFEACAVDPSGNRQCIWPVPYSPPDLTGCPGGPPKPPPPAPRVCLKEGCQPRPGGGCLCQ
jgi:hypothetical protein